jgi:formylglycine-generating enzyme required for sulfatase activity
LRWSCSPGTRSTASSAACARAAADAARLKPLQARIDALCGQRLAALTKDSAFVEGRVLLEQWGTLVPDGGVVQGRALLDGAFAAWQKDEGARQRRAEIEANKRSLLTQAKADQTEKALATLAQLRGRLPADAPFVAVEAPQAIAESYIRQAGNPKLRPETALTLLDKAVALDPRADVAGLRARVERDLARERMGARIADADGASLGRLAEPLAALQKRYPDDYGAWSQDWAKRLAARVSTSAGQDPAGAQALYEAAHALFPQAQIAPPPTVVRPPVSGALADARTALADGRLTAAERALALAREQTPGHPDIARLDQELASAKASAMKALRLSQLARAQGQVAKADKAQAIALKRWSDNPDWQAGASPVTVARGPESCNPRFAGFGNTKKARCADPLSDSAKGPELVVIPAGAASARPYAITRYEITVGELNLYCTTTGECAPIGAQDADLPATGIAIAEAEKYAAWLTRTTGATYRLPTSAQWEQAARAKGEQPNGVVNCLLRSGGQIVKGGTPDLVNHGASNSWGLVNPVGNVQEWTLDGGSVQVHGGHYADDAGRCSATLVSGHSGGPDPYTGFRLVKEIGG